MIGRIAEGELIRIGIHYGVSGSMRWCYLGLGSARWLGLYLTRHFRPVELTWRWRWGRHVYGGVVPKILNNTHWGIR